MESCRQAGGRVGRRLACGVVCSRQHADLGNTELRHRQRRPRCASEAFRPRARERPSPSQRRFRGWRRCPRPDFGAVHRRTRAHGIAGGQPSDCSGTRQPSTAGARLSYPEPGASCCPDLPALSSRRLRSRGSAPAGTKGSRRRIGRPVRRRAERDIRTWTRLGSDGLCRRRPADKRCRQAFGG